VELAKAEEEKLAEEEVINEIRKRAQLKKARLMKESELVGDDPDEENDDDDIKEIKGFNLYRTCKMFYNKYLKGSSTVYRSIVIKIGGKKAALLHRNSL